MRIFGIRTNLILTRVARRFRRLQFNYYDDAEFLRYVAGKSYAFHENICFIETLALRDSHADYGFFPAAFPKSFNLGLTSGDLYTAFQIYRAHQKDLTNLKRIILFFGVFSPGFSLIKTRERYRVVAYNFYFQVPYQDLTSISKRTERMIIKKCRDFPPNEFHEGEFGYRKKTFFLSNIDAEKRAASHLRENRRTPSQIVWLERLSKLAEGNGHRLYVVIPPVRRDYRECLPPKKQLFKDLYLSKFNNVNIIDCFDCSLIEDDGMGDTDHLNEKGAILLTEYLKRAIADIEGNT